MSYHRVCCRGDLSLTIIGVGACFGCRSPILIYPGATPAWSYQNYQSEVNGEFALTYQGISTAWNPAGERQYYADTFPGQAWWYIAHANTTCTFFAGVSAGGAAYYVYLDQTTNEVTRIHAGDVRAGSPEFSGVTVGLIHLGSVERHTIGTTVANQLDCATTPPYWADSAAGAFPGFIIMASGGTARVHR